MASFIIKDSREIYKIAHPSTKAAITAIKALADFGFQASRVLDIGSGSGILALYSASIWPDTVISATDISKRAVKEAEENIEANGLSDRIDCLQADGVDHPQIREFAPCNLIVANMVAEFHMQHIGKMVKLLEPEGYMVIAGILVWRLEEIEHALSHAKLNIVARFEMDGWMALILNPKNRS